MSADSRAPLAPDTTLGRNPRVADQVLDGKAIVLHYEGRRIVGLNEAGTEVWSLLDGRRSLRDVAATLGAARGVAADQALTDVEDFAKQLLARGLLVERSDTPPPPDPVTPHRSREPS